MANEFLVCEVRTAHHFSGPNDDMLQYTSPAANEHTFKHMSC